MKTDREAQNVDSLTDQFEATNIDDHRPTAFVNAGGERNLGEERNDFTSATINRKNATAIRLEALTPAGQTAGLLRRMRDVDFPTGPMAKLVLTNTKSYLLDRNMGFDFTILNLAGKDECMDLYVNCSLHFPPTIAQPSISDFNSEKISSLINFINDDKYMSHISALGGLLTWAEGSFRSRNVPCFHCHLRLCRTELLRESVEPKRNSMTLEALQHIQEAAHGSMKFNLGPSADNGNIDIDRGDCLSIRRRLNSEEGGTDVGVNWIVRHWDAMFIFLWGKGNQCEGITWFPYSTIDYISMKSWLRLDDPHDDRYFYIFGFCNNEKPADVKFATASIKEKADSLSANFLVLDHASGLLTVRKKKRTVDAPEVTRFFQDGPNGFLKAEIIGADGSKTLRLVLCPQMPRPGIYTENQDGNIFFEDDLRSCIIPPGVPALVSTSALQKVLTMIDRGNLLVHPFLPIVAFVLPSVLSEGQPARVILERIQEFLLTLKSSTPNTPQQPSSRSLWRSNRKSDADQRGFQGGYKTQHAKETGCKVALCLHSMRADMTSFTGFGTSTVTDAATTTQIPGWNKYWDSSWSHVAAYCWLEPKDFFSHKLLDNRRDDWLKGFRVNGQQYKVVS